VKFLQKAIWALSICPVDAGGALPPLSVLERARCCAPRDESAHHVGRRIIELCGDAARAGLVCERARVTLTPQPAR